ncbi:hypothetical protein UFOVP178_55 [uncultured Caudovirales phage]|uniref:Uncharacterized protein n=1 Tax=uncultured Caudovirales phage TaxID=2100421 RepID=A0A6J7WCF0_9CAUD|nr:hypothetical protein UFOVP178_55 [uncultured Caudovirales phage]
MLLNKPRFRPLAQWQRDAIYNDLCRTRIELANTNLLAHRHPAVISHMRRRATSQVLTLARGAWG